MTDKNSGKTIVSKDVLQYFATDLLSAGGFSEDHASQTAELLVWANLRGVDSHGVLRIPRYVEMVGLGIINVEAKPEFEIEFGAIAVLNADRAPGAVGMNAASAKAIRLAKKSGIGWCSAKNITHAGAIGYYAQKMANAGMLGIVMTASKPLMTYFGSKVEGVSTNPIAIASPTGQGGNPIILDMSTAAVALGKIMAAKDAGSEIPKGWAVDENGEETTDPNNVKAVLPMSGPKGSGLSLMIEILASILIANPIISKELSGKKGAGLNGIALAIDPRAFGNNISFLEAIDELSGAIKSLPLASNVDQIFLPGERGFGEGEKRVLDGIPLASGTCKRLLQLAQKLKVSTPPEFM